jgi:uncharacterized protein
MPEFAPADGPGRSARLDRVLRELLAQAPELEAVAVVSFDGLPMASALPEGMNEDRLAAMSAALLSLGDRAAQGLGRGDLSQVFVEGEQGTVFLVSADDEAVLVAVASAQAKTGLMLFEVRRSATAVADCLRAEDAMPARGTAAAVTVDSPGEWQTAEFASQSPEMALPPETAPLPEDTPEPGWHHDTAPRNHALAGHAVTQSALTQDPLTAAVATQPAAPKAAGWVD